MIKTQPVFYLILKDLLHRDFLNSPFIKEINEEDKEEINKIIILTYIFSDMATIPTDYLRRKYQEKFLLLCKHYHVNTSDCEFVYMYLSEIEAEINKSN